MTCPLWIQHEYSGYRNFLDLLDIIENATSETFKIVPVLCKQRKHKKKKYKMGGAGKDRDIDRKRETGGGRHGATYE